MIPAFFAIGPLTRIIGASVCPETCISRWFISGWARQSIAAKSTGNCSGRQPAITALIAIFSTVARPNPGSMTMSTSWGARLVPFSICSTAAGVGGITGMPSLQSRSARKRLTASSPSGVSFNSTVKTSVAWPLLRAPLAAPADAGIEVSLSIISSICSSTILWMKSSCCPVVAWGIVTNDALGCPQPSTQDCQALAKLLAAMATAGTPAFSTATMSWASHDVQPPQWAVAPIMASTSVAISVASSSSIWTPRLRTGLPCRRSPP